MTKGTTGKEASGDGGWGNYVITAAIGVKFTHCELKFSPKCEMARGL